MVAIGGSCKGCEVVVEVFGGEEAGTVGEEDVIFGKALLDGGRGGDDEDGSGPEPEV